MKTSRWARIPWAIMPCAIASLLALEAAAYQRAFTLGDMGGVFFEFVVAPALGGVAGAVIVPLFPDGRLIRPLVLTTLAVLVVGWGAYSLGIVNRTVPGYYRLPSGFTFEGRPVDELVDLTASPNEELRYGALERLGTLGPEGANGLVSVIDRLHRNAGERYVDLAATLEATELLAKMGDRRAIPMLRDMARRSVFSGRAGEILATRFGENPDHPPH